MLKKPNMSIADIKITFHSPDCLVRRHPMWLMKFSINSCNSVADVMKTISSFLLFLSFSNHAADPGWLVMLLGTKNTGDHDTATQHSNM